MEGGVARWRIARQVACYTCPIIIAVARQLLRHVHMLLCCSSFCGILLNPACASVQDGPSEKVASAVCYYCLLMLATPINSFFPLFFHFLLSFFVSSLFLFPFLVFMYSFSSSQLVSFQFFILPLTFNLIWFSLPHVMLFFCFYSLISYSIPFYPFFLHVSP